MMLKYIDILLPIVNVTFLLLYFDSLTTELFRKAIVIQIIFLFTLKETTPLIQNNPNLFIEATVLLALVGFSKDKK